MTKLHYVKAIPEGNIFDVAYVLRGKTLSEPDMCFNLKSEDVYITDFKFKFVDLPNMTEAARKLFKSLDGKMFSEFGNALDIINRSPLIKSDRPRRKMQGLDDYPVFDLNMDTN